MVKDELGNYLISARYPHSITYIDGKTQETIWQLGGKSNSFMDLSGGMATNFAWQHDARFVDPDMFPKLYKKPIPKPGYTTKLLSLFDNAAEDFHYHFGLPYSRGLLLEVTYPTPGTSKAKAGPAKVTETNLEFADDATEDEKKLPAINGTDPGYKVRVIKSYDNPGGIRSSSQGSMQILPQGPGEDAKVFVGYGLNAAWSEFDADGTALCDVHFGSSTSFERGDVQSYRAYKFAWQGYPERPPSVLISEDDTEVLVSWNGATEVSEWVLQSSRIWSNNDSDWTMLRSIPKHKFETAITIPRNEMRYLRVAGVNDRAEVLPYGISNILDRGIMASNFPSIAKSMPKTVKRMSPSKVMFIIGCSIMGLFALYEGYRKYLIWRSGRAGAGGPVMFRKGPYRLLADV